MRKTNFKHIVFFIFIVLFSSAEAKDQYNYMTYGMGNDSCATFIKAEENRGSEFYEEMQWVLGYISSKSIQRAREKRVQLKKLDTEGKISVLKKYCSKNGIAYLADATEALWLVMMMRTPQISEK